MPFAAESVLLKHRIAGPPPTRWQDVAFDLELLHHRRLSSAEIENRLLIGEVLEWDDLKTAQKRTIHLNLARQRRLLKVLLDTSVRNVRGLSAGFVQSLKDAYVGGEDPAAKTLLSNKASEHLKTLAEDLRLPTTHQEQNEVSVAVARAEEEMPAGITHLPLVQDLERLVAASDNGELEVLRRQIQLSRTGLEEARLWRRRQQVDSKLRLKIVAARWHYEHHPEATEIQACPLCEQNLADRPALAAELSGLRKQTELAEQTFSQTCSALENALRATWPKTIEYLPERWEREQPKFAIVTSLRSKFVQGERYSTLLLGVARRVETWLRQAEASWPELAIFPNFGDDSAERALQSAISAAERLLALADWWKVHRIEFVEGWQDLMDGRNDGDSVRSCLSRCKEALALAEPFQEAAGFLADAFTAASTWLTIEAEQQSRDAIADAITPLKDLRQYVHHNTVIAINLLSAQIGDTLRRIYLIDKLRYENTTIAKNVVTVHGSFNDRYKINAALVANTSWLRAVLWAFIFALRHETLTRLARNPLPLMVLDDPKLRSIRSTEESGRS